MKRVSKIRKLIEEAKEIQKEKNHSLLREWEMEELATKKNLNKFIYQVQEKIMKIQAIVCDTTVVPGSLFKRGWLYIPEKEVKRKIKNLKKYKQGYVIKIVNY